MFMGVTLQLLQMAATIIKSHSLILLTFTINLFTFNAHDMTQILVLETMFLSLSIILKFLIDYIFLHYSKSLVKSVNLFKFFILDCLNLLF